MLMEDMGDTIRPLIMYIRPLTRETLKRPLSLILRKLMGSSYEGDVLCVMKIDSPLNSVKTSKCRAQHVLFCYRF
jgi:hypothetical protein